MYVNHIPHCSFCCLEVFDAVVPVLYTYSRHALNIAPFKIVPSTGDTPVGTSTCHSISFSYSIPFHVRPFLLLSVQQSTHRSSQQQLNNHSKPHSNSLLHCILPRTEKMAPCKRDYLPEATPISSDDQSMTEQADKQSRE